MPTIGPIDVASATGTTAETLAAVKKSLGMVPNLFATLAQSPAALQTYFGIKQGLAAGTLTARQHELIALAVAQANGCQYCLSAHTVLNGMLGTTAADMKAARAGRGANPRDDAILSLAREVVEKRGRLAPAQVVAYKSRGLSDADILETVSSVVHNILTNYVNEIAGTEIDFPVIELAQAA